jgi:hypothetical protein
MLKQFAVGLFASFLAFTVSSQAQTYEEAVALPNALIFSVTAGSWSEEVELAQEADVETTPETDSGTDSSTVSTDAVEVMLMEGYYRLSAFEKVDKTSIVFLQKIARGDEGLTQHFTLELEEISVLDAYITDIRLENPNSTPDETGFAAYIFLKTDPNSSEPETYSVYIDDLDSIYVEPASN